MSQRSARRPSERGATAVLTALLAVLLVGISAFTVDFGRSYLSKRQLQNAADAGSLAGASYYVDKPGDCAALSLNASYESDSKDIAKAIIEESRPGATLDSYKVGCLAGELLVEASVIGSTPVAFGAVYGTSSITTQRAAEATVEVPEVAGRGLRPYMICSTYAPAPSSLPMAWTRVEFPTTANANGSCPNAGGNWFTVQCPNDGNGGGNSLLAEQTLDGCPPEHPVSVVTPQNASSPTTLYDSLMVACPSQVQNLEDFDPDCLTSDTGSDMNSQGVKDAWQSLLGQTILLPVFCAKGPCIEAAWKLSAGGNGNGNGNGNGGGGGTNVMYPVHKFASVIVCGYHWASNAEGGVVTSDPQDKCFGAKAIAEGDNSNDKFLLLAFIMYQTSGSTVDSACPLNDPNCDAGARQVRLTK